MAANDKNSMPLFNEIQSGDTSSESLNIVSLPYDQRQRSRLRVVVESGPLADKAVGIDLERGTVLRDETLLVSTSGDLLMVRASAEDLCEVMGNDAASLTRLAYHLGNRHVPVQLLTDRLRIRPDHVLEEMVTGLGGKTQSVQAAFDPEGGAYGGGHHHHLDDDDHHHGHTPPDVNHAPRIHDLSGN